MHQILSKGRALPSILKLADLYLAYLTASHPLPKHFYFIFISLATSSSTVTETAQVKTPERVAVSGTDTTSPDDARLQLERSTPEECLVNFENFINSEKRGLSNFYDKVALTERAKDAAQMVNKLREMNCGKETSKQLSILCLYDVVMLIDDSSSMCDEEKGERITTLKATMEEITRVYDLARPKGLLSVKFINSMKGYKNIDQPRVPHVMKSRVFWGTTQIGSALQKKIIDNFVFKCEMKKPLLVMIITDGEPEGESQGHLKTVIDECVEKLQADKTRGKDAVAFHFSRVGNDEGAARLLRELDERCRNVDCLRADYALERLRNESSRWDVLPKLLLGAIVSSININDDEEKEKGDDSEKVDVSTLEDEDDEEIDLPEGRD